MMEGYVNKLDKASIIEMARGAVIERVDMEMAKVMANIQRERIRSIVRLKPYRTFPELEQPESEFLVRLSADEEGHIRVALHEADGGMWKLTARRIIAGYLKEALSQEIADGKVTVIG